MTYITLDLGITKIYLLKCNGGYLLIDTGYENDYPKFIKQLKKNKITIDQIKYVLLTHYHDDHAGFASKIKKEFNIPLIVQKESVSLLSVGNSGTQEKDYPINKRIGFIFSLFMIVHKNFEYPAVIIDDNDIVINQDDNKFLRSIGVNADIIFTPGHTRDSMCVLCDDKTAFVGDAAMNFLRFAGSDYRPIFYVDLNQTYESMKKLIKAGTKTIVPAHGKPYSIDKLIKSVNKYHK